MEEQTSDVQKTNRKKSTLARTKKKTKKPSETKQKQRRDRNRSQKSSLPPKNHQIQTGPATMHMKVACPHCQVVGMVPEDLKFPVTGLSPVIIAVNIILCLLFLRHHLYHGRWNYIVQNADACRRWIRTFINPFLKIIFHCFARIATPHYQRNKMSLSLIRQKQQITALDNL